VRESYSLSIDDLESAVAAWCAASKIEEEEAAKDEAAHHKQVVHMKLL
jgi:hypothetical protein